MAIDVAARLMFRSGLTIAIAAWMPMAYAAKIPILVFITENPWLLAITALTIGIWIYFKVAASEKASKLEAAAKAVDAANESGDHAAAAAGLRTLAEAEVASAQSALGHALLAGRGVTEDIPQALQWLGKASSAGDAFADRLLGICHLQGLGTPKDAVKARDHFQRAANKEDEVAKLYLGHLHHDGDGVPQDYAAASSWYREAAECGNAEAAYRLAEMLEAGRVVAADRDEALGWYRKAADAGYGPARQLLDARSTAPGTPHPQIPNLIYGDSGWMPAKGFTWASDDPNDHRVRFEQAGQPVAGRENCVYDIDGRIAPAPGFRWATEDPNSLVVEPVPHSAS